MVQKGGCSRILLAESSGKSGTQLCRRMGQTNGDTPAPLDDELPETGKVVVCLLAGNSSRLTDTAGTLNYSGQPH